MKNNFRTVNSCVNCKYAFHDWSPEYPEIYCTFEMPPRPPSYFETLKYDDELYEKWYDWSQDKVVSVNTICDDWKKYEAH